jgi:ABC-type enterochelin transport system permease subunit
MKESLDYAEQIAKTFKNKADLNKKESLACFTFILVSSLSAPLFITLGKGDLLGKIIPSILSVMTAGLTSWLQLHKPQKLWSM